MIRASCPTVLRSPRRTAPPAYGPVTVTSHGERVG